MLSKNDCRSELSKIAELKYSKNHNEYVFRGRTCQEYQLSRLFGELAEGRCIYELCYNDDLDVEIVQSILRQIAYITYYGKLFEKTI